MRRAPKSVLRLILGIFSAGAIAAIGLVTAFGLGYLRLPYSDPSSLRGKISDDTAIARYEYGGVAHDVTAAEYRASSVNLHSTNIYVPSISTWSYGNAIDQPITNETWKEGDLYYVRIQNMIDGKLSSNIGTTNVRIDKTNPVPSASFDDKTGTFKNHSTDALSGVKITEVKIDKLINDWTNIDDVTVTTPSEHVVTIRTTDNAGNVAQTQIKIKVPEKSTEPETKLEVKSEVKPEAKPEVKPVTKPETNPETNPDTGNLGDGFSLLMSN